MKDLKNHFQYLNLAQIPRTIDMEDSDPDLESYWWCAQLFSRSFYTIDYMLEWYDRISRRKSP